MRIVRHIDELKHRDASVPLFLAIGAFDGIHIGHQTLLRAARDEAKAQGGEAWVMTFDPHPSRILRPNDAPPLLTSTAHKMRCLEPLALDGCITHPFSEQIAAYPPLEFLNALLENLPGLHTVLVGFNWHFGCQARGDIALLRAWAEPLGIHVMIPEPVTWNGELVSSTRIRKAIEEGNLDAAEAMLGRPFSLQGTVTTGRQLARELGFPTANILLEDEAHPPIGIYAVYALHQGQRHHGAAYLGLRPAPDGPHLTPLLEVHLLDVSIDLYGQTIEVFFAAYLRAEQRFDDVETLKTQIARDVQRARDYFNEK